ncbi:MAG: sensor histidine kinase [Acidobacteriaceae bacterium]
MKHLPLRLRLTLWYFAILASGLLLFAVFVLLSLDHAIHRTVDRQLNDHLAAVRQVLEEDANKAFTNQKDANEKEGNGGEAQLTHDLAEDIELSPGSMLLEVWDTSGRPVYRSANMDHMHVPEALPQPTGHAVTRKYGHTDLRLMVQQMVVVPNDYTVFVAIPIHAFQEMMEQVRGLLWASVAVLLLFSVSGGYWMAQRALRPMDAMIQAAAAIQPADLSSRLEVPHTGDELERLATTLNSMLGRMEAGFERITRFTADASHELRTPIALLRTRTEVLLRRPRTAGEYRAALESNLADLEHTSVILGDLMLLARADAGAETLHFARVNLKELVQTTCDRARPLADAKDLSWSVELPAAPLWVQADADALQRLLLILIDNAVKYTPAAGRLAIALALSGEDAVLTVQDNGVGIAAEDMPYIFERFYRADKSRTRSSGGAGLGLAIGRWIAQQHSGTLTAESTPRAGSIFRVVLPCAAGPA